jgi:hypothetical protein
VNDADPIVVRGLKKVGVDRLPQRPFDLDGGDRVHRQRPPELIGGYVRQSQMTDKAVLHQLRHRADSLLDRHDRIGQVQVVEVDAVCPQPGGACLGVATNQPGIGVDRELAGDVADRETVALHPGRRLHAELGGHDTVVPVSSENLPDQVLVVELAPIGVSGVDQSHARVDDMAEGGLGVTLVDRAVDDLGSIAQRRRLQGAESPQRPQRRIATRVTHLVLHMRP